LDAQHFALQFAVRKHKGLYIQNYNFACCCAWVETWTLTLTEELLVKFLGNRIFRRIFEPNKIEVTGEGEHYIMRGVMSCYHPKWFG
jgi:uracil-DNA glycosylase